MLKLLFKTNKSLVVTKPQRIFQRESNANLLCIYVPHEYYDYDLTQFVCTLYYIDAGSNMHSEILETEETDKEGYIKYILPLTSKFTYVAGDNEMWITLSNTNPEDQRNYVIKSTKLTIPIIQQSDYFTYIDESSLETIDRRILELKSISDELANSTSNIPSIVPADLELHSQHLQLVNDEGRLMGEGVEISDGGYDGDMDQDGIIDLAETDPEFDPSGGESGGGGEYPIGDPDGTDDALIDLDVISEDDDGDPDGVDDGMIDLEGL